MFIVFSCRRGRFFIKFPRRNSFYIQFVVVFIIFLYTFDRIFIDRKRYQRNIIVQNDLLDYNEDGLRQGWPFKINKHYDVTELRTYTSKPKVLPKASLPGERGDEIHRFTFLPL